MGAWSFTPRLPDPIHLGCCLDTGVVQRWFRCAGKRGDGDSLHCSLQSESWVQLTVLGLSAGASVSTACVLGVVPERKRRKQLSPKTESCSQMSVFHPREVSPARQPISPSEPGLSCHSRGSHPAPPLRSSPGAESGQDGWRKDLLCPLTLERGQDFCPFFCFFSVFLFSLCIPSCPP